MMLNILSILKHIHDGIQNADPRYTVQDDEHILDTKSGVLLHVYDNWFKIRCDIVDRRAEMSKTREISETSSDLAVLEKRLEDFRKTTWPFFPVRVEVKGCPLCNKSDLEIDIKRHNGGHFVQCKGCNLNGLIGPTPKDAIELWNERG